MALLNLNQKIKFLEFNKDNQYYRRDFIYQLGINEDKNPLQKEKCSKGGIYYTTVEHCHHWVEFGNYVAILELCDDSIYIDERCGTKSKADKINIIEIIPIADFFLRILEPLIIKCLLQKASLIKYIPDHLKSKELFIQFLVNDPCIISLVPVEYLKSNICEQVVIDRPILFMRIPDHLKTEEMSIHATYYYPELVKYVPPKFYAKLSLRAIYEVPNEYKTKEFWYEVVPRFGSLLEFVKEEDKTYELCEKAVISWCCAIDHVPNKFKTPELIAKVNHQCYITVFENNDKINKKRDCDSVSNCSTRAIASRKIQIRTC
jgi:hypothetical protein